MVTHDSKSDLPLTKSENDNIASSKNITGSVASCAICARAAQLAPRARARPGVAIGTCVEVLQ